MYVHVFHPGLSQYYVVRLPRDYIEEHPLLLVTVDIYLGKGNGVYSSSVLGGRDPFEFSRGDLDAR